MKSDLLPVVVAVAVLLAGLTTSVTAAQTTARPAHNVTTEAAVSSSQAPTAGAFLSGAISTQRAQIAGSLSVRTFDVRLAHAATATERAAILAEYHNSTEAKLGALEARRERLRERREAGRLSPGRYRYELAELSADTRSVETVSARGNARIRDLPTSARRAAGLDDAQFTAMHTTATELRTDIERETTPTVGPSGVGTNVPGIGRPQRVPGIGGPISIDGLHTTTTTTTTTESIVDSDPSLTTDIDAGSTPRTTVSSTARPSETTRDRGLSDVELGASTTTSKPSTTTSESAAVTLTTESGDTELVADTVETAAHTGTAGDESITGATNSTGTTLPYPE
jgi:hypothetical protein